MFQPGDVCSPWIAIYLEIILLCKNSDTKKQKKDRGAYEKVNCCKLIGMDFQSVSTMETKV